MKFVYKINQKWWIIIEPKFHYYYNVETKESCWQLPLELEFTDINLNEVSILIAKSNGLRVDIVNGDGTTKKGGSETIDEPKNDVNIEEDNDINEKENESNEDLYIEPEEENLPIEPEVKEKEPEKLDTGISLGYSSSEDDESEVDNDDNEDNEENQDNDDFFDVDDIVNQLVHENEKSDEESDEYFEENNSNDQFIELLNTHKNDISIYNPYSITEESLITELSQSPAFYKLTFAEREKIYNQWAGTIVTTQQKYPSQIQLYIQHLFSIKSEVKNSFYFDFKQQLSKYHVQNKETIFTKYKTILSQQTDFEKQYKRDKSKDQSINLKKLKLAEFLKSTKLKVPKDYIVYGENDFEKWIHLCNDLNLPETIVEDEMNWILGDSKRLECYLGI